MNESPTPTKSVNIGSWISRGWELVNADFGPFLMLGLIYLVVTLAASGTVLGEIILVGPLSVGFYYVILQRMRGKPVDIGNLGKGFNFFAAAVISHILIGAFVTVGTILCIIPGLIVAALYMFTALFIADKNMDFWEAMEASRKVIQQHLFEMILFLIVLGIILLIGGLLLVVGLVFAFPLVFAATAMAYDDLVGMERE